jgi:hypothetical protein
MIFYKRNFRIQSKQSSRFLSIAKIKFRRPSSLLSRETSSDSKPSSPITIQNRTSIFSLLINLIDFTLIFTHPAKYKNRFLDLNLSNFLGVHTKKPPEKKKKGAEVTDQNAQAPSVEAQPLTSPLSVKFKIHKNPIFSTNGELSDAPRDTYDGPYVDDDQEELMTFVLTEDIFVEILSLRLQVKQFSYHIQLKS